MTLGDPGPCRLGFVGEGMGHGQRSEDIGLQIVGVLDSGGLFDEITQDVVVGVGVLEFSDGMAERGGGDPLGVRLQCLGPRSGPTRLTRPSYSLHPLVWDRRLLTVTSDAGRLSQPSPRLDLPRGVSRSNALPPPVA